MRRSWLSLALLLALLVGATPAAADSHEDDGASVHDPWEGMNRGIFAFNEGVDRYFLRHVATGWDALWPDPFERSLRDMLQNAQFPVVFLNNWLQWKPKQAGVELGRFLINSTLGVGGLFDPATHFGLEGHGEDFGQTLAVWGVPRGPYLVLPLLGPSSPRDAGGRVVDGAAQVWPWFAPFGVALGVASGNAINTRSLNAETIDAEREAAFDWYAAVRNAYTQLRENQIRDRKEDEEGSDDDLYYFDEE